MAQIRDFPFAAGLSLRHVGSSIRDDSQGACAVICRRDPEIPAHQLDEMRD
jgi:hypothetical protein